MTIKSLRTLGSLKTNRIYDKWWDVLKRLSLNSKQGEIEYLAMNLDMSKLVFSLLWITLGAGNFVPSFLCFAHIIHGGLLCSRSALTVNKALIIADPMYPGVYYMVNLFLNEYVNIKIILDYDGQKCHLILSLQRSFPNWHDLMQLHMAWHFFSSRKFIWSVYTKKQQFALF